MKIQEWDGFIERIPMLKSAIDIMKILKPFGDIVIVGGVVRDILGGEKDPDDIDLATNVSESTIKNLFETFDIGKNKKFGVTVVKHQGFTFEIAQFRKDEYSDTKGKGASSVEIVKDFKDDASRRDFTINQIAVDENGNIIDHFFGQVDIRNRIVKCVGDPFERFTEDSVRMLRAVRFSNRLNFFIDQDTASAIKDLSGLLRKVASERIMKEILKMANQSGSKFADAIILLDNLGLLHEIFPEISLMRMFPHNPEHHPEGNVWEHTIAALRCNEFTDPILNLAILFHDVGKIETFSLKGTGINTFHGHAKKSMDIIDNICDRLKIDNKTRKALVFCGGKHMQMHDFFKIRNSKLMRLISDENWNMLFQVGFCDDKCRLHLFNQNHWDDILIKVQKLTNSFNNKSSIAKLKKNVKGDDIMRIRNIKPGQEVGEIIAHTIEWIHDNDVDLDDIPRIHKFIKEIEWEK